ncbi:hypothetical protein GS429_10125 [Natronorubrum sp. JWXQ-INN-674]|uniref:Uncharacterized protein n=1 Tax=Natronorubrum halalkaliphilum TaxID=2691917 RepID=A0A6B0VLH6_9EURY|nr:hypothetical protein [Natronorubrum halalkaliphilum]MXV62414.1 hypothetical protein [Natronorubrum halalkaliphilum]
MKTVQDDTGKRYLLLKRSEHASLVRDPQNGNECYVQNDRLEDIDEQSALETAARTVSTPVRTLLTNVHDEATLGLLLELENRGPIDIRTLLDAYDFCETDLHGRLTVLSAADLLEEVDVAGERGYRLTDECTTALRTIRPETDTEPATDIGDESVSEPSENTT